MTAFERCIGVGIDETVFLTWFAGSPSMRVPRDRMPEMLPIDGR